MNREPNKNQVIINSRKFDGSIHRTWQAELIKTEDSMLVFVGKFEKEINHEHLGVIRRGTISYEFYWLDKGYNVFRFHEPEGVLRNYYCNLNLPPTFTSNSLDYIDLDIDVLVWSDFSLQILDMDEFKENAEFFGYPETIRLEVDKNLNELLFLIDQKLFPFDFTD